ncbi:3-deoxy-D-manno-octulosonic acid transferase [Adhaeretor mobilis]|uniref:3-deoxy-D-manno-octulosonic acid transferase n=1 Tax=Adhaeretor mobilis TaxID=1930276 RepID=A0A517MZ98_9BACT|nr:3-deoxy-D-manno-octulosonic acid transferase [Adhaeretor mobilis]QDT00184.1 3-deoxy-D-manno-octulosonic acid transferase [Adhaeretor mobilis]
MVRSLFFNRLMPWMLNGAYACAIGLALPWIFWAAWQHGKYREGFAQKLLGMVPRRTRDSPSIWLHAVSVGEVNLLSTLVRELVARQPDLEIVISTTTKTGYDLARNKYDSHTVFYCPLDFTWAVRRAMRRIRPQLLVLAELELWPNLIAAAKNQGAKVAIANGRLSERSHRGYSHLHWLVSTVLQKIDAIAVQNEATAKRFLSLSANPAAVHCTGSLKFDGAETYRQNPRTQELAKLAGINSTDTVLLAGSTQEPEEHHVLAAYQRLSQEYSTLRLILVPRHPQRFEEVAALLDDSGIPWQRRSLLAAAQTNGAQTNSEKPRVLLVDTIGELGAWWGTAKIAFVGGSFGKREGQNMLEPAAYGAAVSFGPRTRNFRDIVRALLSAEAAEVLREPEDIEAFTRRCLDEPQWAAALGQRAQQVVASHQGATEKTVDLLEELLDRLLATRSSASVVSHVPTETAA